MSDAIAELFEHNDAGTPLALGAPGVFAKWVSSGVSFAGPSDLVVPSAASDDFTIGANGGALYLILVSVSFGSDKPNSLTECSLFLNGIENPAVGFHRTIGNAVDQGAAPAHGLVQCVPGDVLDLRFNSTVNNTTLDLYHVTMTLWSVLRDQ